MEKALAREDSWGLGDAVNSMAPRAWSRPGPAVQLPPGTHADRHAATSVRGRRAQPGTADESAPTSGELRAGLSGPPPQRPGAGETSTERDRAGKGRPRAGPDAPGRAVGRAGGAHPLRPAPGSRVLPPPRLPPGTAGAPQLQGGGDPRSATDQRRTPGPRAHCARARAALRLNSPAPAVPPRAASQRRPTSPRPRPAAGGGAAGQGRAGRARPRARARWGQGVPPRGRCGRRRAPRRPAVRSPGGREARAVGRGISVATWNPKSRVLCSACTRGTSRSSSCSFSFFFSRVLKVPKESREAQKGEQEGAPQRWGPGARSHWRGGPQGWSPVSAGLPSLSACSPGG